MSEIPSIPQTDYYLAIDGKRYGPFDSTIIKRKIGNGEIAGETLIWKRGMSSWMKIYDFEDFKDLFAENFPPPIPV
jgi:hypothetical protein